MVSGERAGGGGIILLTFLIVTCGLLSRLSLVHWMKLATVAPNVVLRSMDNLK